MPILHDWCLSGKYSNPHRPTCRKKNTPPEIRANLLPRYIGQTAVRPTRLDLIIRHLASCSWGINNAVMQCAEGMNETYGLLYETWVHSKDDAEVFMMTSSNGNIFRVTSHLCGEFTGPRWVPRTQASNVELWCFSLICVWINGWVNSREAGDLRRYRAHYGVTVIEDLLCFVCSQCYPCFSGLPHWHWAIVVPVKWPWSIWVILFHFHDSSKTDDINISKQNTTKSFEHLLNVL